MSLRLETRIGKLLERMAEEYGLPKAEIVRRATIEYVLKWTVPGLQKLKPPPDVKNELKPKA